MSHDLLESTTPMDSEMLESFLKPSLFWRPTYLAPSAWTEHIPFAFWITQALRPRVIVELGTHWGTSYFAFCQAVERLGLNAKCWAVDTWEGDEHAGKYDESVFMRVKEHNASLYSHFSSLIRSRFDEAAKHFDDQSIDLLHIDGLHTYESVKHDFETWLPKCSERAIVLLHDTNVKERNFGVHRLFGELTSKFPTFEFDHCHGLGIVFVGAALEPLCQKLLIARKTSSQTIGVKEIFSQAGSVFSARLDVQHHQKLQSAANREAERQRKLADALREKKNTLEKNLREQSLLASSAEREHAKRINELELNCNTERARVELLEVELNRLHRSNARLQALANRRHEAIARTRAVHAHSAPALKNAGTAHQHSPELSVVNEVASSSLGDDGQLAPNPRDQMHYEGLKSNVPVVQLSPDSAARGTGLNAQSQPTETSQTGAAPKKHEQELSRQKVQLSLKNGEVATLVRRIEELEKQQTADLAAQSSRNQQYETRLKEVNTVLSERNRALYAATDEIIGLYKQLRENFHEAASPSSASIAPQMDGEVSALLARNRQLEEVCERQSLELSQFARLHDELDDRFSRLQAETRLGAREIGYSTRCIRNALKAPDTNILRVEIVKALVYLSGLFDSDWYLERYPDVRSSGLDPLDHYIGFGGAELRDPSERFSSIQYLEQNPDLKSSATNPLVHFLVIGNRDE